MKKRTISLLLVVLAFCMLFGVGFASWVISNSKSNTANGKIAVDTVTDNRVAVTTEWKDSKDTIVFGYEPSFDQTGENVWLKNSATDKQQNLSVTLLVHVKDEDGAGTEATVTATLSYAEGLTFDSKYIVAPAAGAVTVTPVEGVTGDYEVTLTFTWGSAFDGKNPIVYYNGLAVDGNDAIGITTGQDNGDVAKANLEAIAAYQAAVEGVDAFTLTINVAK